jgi:hypothetical protein
LQAHPFIVVTSQLDLTLSLRLDSIPDFVCL